MFFFLFENKTGVLVLYSPAMMAITDVFVRACLAIECKTPAGGRGGRPIECPAHGGGPTGRPDALSNLPVPGVAVDSCDRKNEAPAAAR